jgi:hypothetical protein
VKVHYLMLASSGALICIACLVSVGEYIADSSLTWVALVPSSSRWGRLSPLSPSSSEPGPPSFPGEQDEYTLLSSFKRLSSPSTLFRRASKTSVFGPRFLGTASGDHHQYSFSAVQRITITINARTLENLTSLTSRP